MITRLVANREQVFELNAFPVIIGRGENATLRLSDRWVSRLHCQIDVTDQGTVIRDLHSRHGTFVNDDRVDEAVLKPGDKIMIGLTVFEAAREGAPAHAGKGSRLYVG